MVVVAFESSEGRTDLGSFVTVVVVTAPHAMVVVVVVLIDSILLIFFSGSVRRKILMLSFAGEGAEYLGMEVDVTVHAQDRVLGGEAR